ncbi:MAG: response regulator transcription factor [Clostridiales Family XIII bacterium]|jgi:DNA-binding response OmpR family regulator|nr:response regulator transcription factor [Clostridiales Family XIII bacterium]
MTETIPILVVEDDPAINRLLCETLTGAGYSPDSAFSGSEAILALDARLWKCVILDLMLPGKSGAEVLAAIRRSAHVPVIVLSAKTDKESKIELLKGGADDYITKPFDVDELLARVEAQLRRLTAYTDGEARRVLIYSDIQMDPEIREVTVGGAPVHLTVREYEILELFLRHPRKVYSRSNIYESVWGEEFIGDEKTVNVHVGNLRAKLNRLSPHKHIKAVWGVGFRLAE